MFLVMKENSYASKVVRIDKKGGQKVISTSPFYLLIHIHLLNLNKIKKYLNIYGLNFKFEF